MRASVRVAHVWRWRDDIVDPKSEVLSVPVLPKYITISECNEESFCQGGAIGDLFPLTLFLNLVVGIYLLLQI